MVRWWRGSDTFLSLQRHDKAEKIHSLHAAFVKVTLQVTIFAMQGLIGRSNTSR